MIRFRCTRCNKRLKADIAAAGRRATCSKCGCKLTVPDLLPEERPGLPAQPSTPAPSNDFTDALRDLNHSDFDARIDALAKLRELKNLDAVEPLIQLLQDRDARIRQETAYTLEILGDSRAVLPLIAALVDLDGDVRLKVARALGVLKDERAIESLCVHLRDPDQIVRVFAAYALERIGNPSALPFLRKALEQTTHEEAARAIRETIAVLERVAPATPKPSVSSPQPETGRAAAKRYNDMSNVADQALAERNLRSAIDADPDWAIPHCNLGRLYFQQGRTSEARQCFMRAYQLAKARLNPGDDLVCNQSDLHLRMIGSRG